MDLEPSPYDDAFDVSLGLDPENDRIAILYTNGLEQHGFPELAIELPEWFEPSGDVDVGEFGLFLAQALCTMAVAVFEADGVQVLPLETSFDDEPVMFWFTDGPPRGVATARFHEEISEMREIDCSLWSDAVPLSAVV